MQWANNSARGILATSAPLLGGRAFEVAEPFRGATIPLWASFIDHYRLQTRHLHSTLF